MNKKRIIYLTILIMALLSGIWLFSRNIGYHSFVVSSEPGADISVAVATGETFVNIGVGTANYSTKQKGPVFVKAEKDGRITGRTVMPVESDGATIHLPLENTVSAKTILDSPVAYSLMKDGVIFGVDELTHLLVNYSPYHYVYPKASFITIPYVKKVVWSDPDNFYYQTYTGYVGAVINDEDLGTDYLKDKVSAASPSGSANVVLDLSRNVKKPLLLLGYGAIYTSSDIGKAVTKIADVAPSGDYYFGGDKYVYYGESASETDYETEGDVKDSSTTDYLDSLSSYLTVLDYSGTQIFKTSLSGVENIRSVTSSSNPSGFFVASNLGLIQLDSGGNVVKNYDLPFALLDVSAVNNRLYLFSSDAVWSFDANTGNYSLLYDFGGYRYVPGTFQPGTDGTSGFVTVMSADARSGNLQELTLN